MLNKTALLFLLLTAGVLSGMNSNQENSSQSSHQVTNYTEQTVRLLIRLADPDLVTLQLLDINWPTTDNGRYLLNLMSTIGLYPKLEIPFDVYTAYPLVIGQNITHAAARLMNCSPEWVRSYALACLARYANLNELQSSTEIDLHTLNRIRAIQLLLHRSAYVCINMDQPAVITVLQDPVALGALFILPTITLPLPPITWPANTPEEQQTVEDQQRAQEQRRLAEVFMGAEEQRMAQEHHIRALEMHNLQRTKRLLLFAAIRQGAVPALNMLLEYIDHTRTTQNGTNNTPVHFAVMCNRPDILRVLLQRDRSNIEATNANGHTALHLAVMYNNSDSVYALLESDASMYARTPTGQTALDIAQELYNNSSIVQLLRQYMIQQIQNPLIQARTRLAPVLQHVPAPLNGLVFSEASQ